MSLPIEPNPFPVPTAGDPGSRATDDDVVLDPDVNDDLVDSAEADRIASGADTDAEADADADDWSDKDGDPV